jgi:hypothetical protein
MKPKYEFLEQRENGWRVVILNGKIMLIFSLDRTGPHWIE